MATYGALLRRIPTSEINRLLRDCNYSRWSYFIDETAGKVGIVFANDTTFGAYIVDDDPDPKLKEYGLEAIKDLYIVPDPQLLVVMAGEHQLQAAVFNDPMTVIEDEFLPSFSYEAVHDWRKFLAQRGVGRPVKPAPKPGRWIAVGVAVAIVIYLVVLR